MSRPDKCKWCGQPKKNESLSATRYLCNTQYFRLIGTWVRGGQCEREELRKRVATAIEALKTIDRYSIEGVYDFGAIGKYDKLGDWVHFEDLEAVVAILEGKA